MTIDEASQQMKETIKRDPALIKMEQDLANRKKELEEKYPVKKVGLAYAS